MLSVPYVLANFNQIRNVSADFFGKKCAISKFSTEIRARCVKTGKRTDMTRLTGVSPSPPPRHYAYPRPINISSTTNFFANPPSSSPVCYTRTDGRTRTANFCNSSSGRVRNISRRGYYSVLFCRYTHRRTGSMVST